MSLLFYAVKKGRKPGIYHTWPECQAQVNGFPGGQYKKFTTEYHATQYLVGVTTHREILSPTEFLTKPRRPATNSPTVLPETTIIYCDGACPFNGRPRARAGLGVYFGPNDSRNLSEPLHYASYRQTNQVAELMAAIRAIEQCGTCQTPLKIISDSTYVVKGMNEWRHTWKKTGKWVLDNKLANRQLWHRLDALVTEWPYPIEFEWVKGHDKSEGNIQADLLATQAADQAPTKPRLVLRGESDSD